MGIENRLMNIKRTISTAESNHDQLKGRRTELVEQLKKKHDCSTTEEATKLHKKNKKQLSKLKDSLETDVDKVQGLL